MTLQVALVGTDGIVLASDQKINSTRGGLIHSSLTSKIKCDPQRRIAVCWSGYDIANELAKRILKLSDTDLRYSIGLEGLAREVFEKGRIDCDSPCAGGEVILVHGGNLTNIQHIKARADRYECEEFRDKTVSGDTSNPSVFFTERFYKPCGIKELSRIAAHTILEAGRINPQGIKDLEILICKKDSFEFLSSSEIDLLKKWSESESAKLQNSMFPAE